jgi:triosephosphate isomerase
MIVEAQLKRCLEEVKLDPKRRLAIAYEPVWAIGTGRQPSPADVRSMHQIIRDELVLTYGEARGGAIPVLYGGSVIPFNVAPMVAHGVADGVLAGGASLNPDSFLGIVRQVRQSAQRP